MTLEQLTVIITGIVNIIILVMTYLNRKAIRDVHVSLNSRLTEMLARNKDASMAEGREIGRSENKV